MIVFLVLGLQIVSLHALKGTSSNIYYGTLQAKEEVLPDGNEVIKIYSSEFPYMAEIVVNGGHYCGGALIKDNLVLTAAHCFGTDGIDIDIVKKYSVIAGNQLSNDIDSPYAQKRQVKAIKQHEDYLSDGYFDIAIVKVDPPFNMNKFVNIINLPKANQLEDMYVYEDSIMLGWGETIDGSQSKSLFKMHGFSMKPCTIFPRQLCVIGNDDKVTMCFGDSGGPQVIHNRDPLQDVIIGVLSGGSTTNSTAQNREICDATKHSDFMNVAYFADWISEKMKTM